LFEKVLIDAQCQRAAHRRPGARFARAEALAAAALRCDREKCVLANAVMARELVAGQWCDATMTLVLVCRSITKARQSQPQ